MGSQQMDMPGDPVPVPDGAKVVFPGKINLAGEIPGTYTGCQAIEFTGSPMAVDGEIIDGTPVEQMNKYFAKLNNRLVTSILPTPRGSLIVLYTLFLSDEQLKWFKESSELVHAEMEKRSQARKEHEAKAEVARIEAEAEQKRLAEVGKKYEQHLSKKIETLEEEIERLKAENRKLRKADK